MPRSWFENIEINKNWMFLKFTLFKGQYDVLDSVVSSDRHTREWPYLQLSKMNSWFGGKKHLSLRIHWKLTTLLGLFTYKVSLWTTLIIIPSTKSIPIDVNLILVASPIVWLSTHPVAVINTTSISPLPRAAWFISSYPGLITGKCCDKSVDFKTGNRG